MKNIPDDFNDVRNKGQELYKTLARVYCSYFQEDIVFNLVIERSFSGASFLPGE